MQIKKIFFAFILNFTCRFAKEKQTINHKNTMRTLLRTHDCILTSEYRPIEKCKEVAFCQYYVIGSCFKN